MVEESKSSNGQGPKPIDAQTANMIKSAKSAAQNGQAMIDELRAKIAGFHQSWNDVNKTFLKKIFGGFKEPEEYQNRPEQLTPEEAAQRLIGKKKITILTGAGISLASGVPTFRCKDGHWANEKAYGGETDRRVLATKQFFAKNPMASWERYHDFYKLMVGKSPNVGHQAVTRFLEHCFQSSNETDAILITQNVDNLHAIDVKNSAILSQAVDPRYVDSDLTNQAWTPFVYELHGNGYYMHCNNEESECSRKIIPAPTLEQLDDAFNAAAEKELTLANGLKQNFCFLPHCESCGSPMKPNVMYFDESYSEHYYRTQTIQRFVNETDCMIVIGTALETSKAKALVVDTLAAEIPIIEINMESAINRGNNLQILGKAEETLPAFFDAYFALVGENSSNAHYQ